jgi:hypothetical protein
MKNFKKKFSLNFLIIFEKKFNLIKNFVEKSF